MIQQALKEGVAKHKEGDLREAERLYRNILQVQQNHPEANHNLGIITVSRDQLQAALPFFKAAIEAAPSKWQFWVSLIDTLIKLGRSDNAKQILQQARDAGLDGDSVDQLEKKLNSVLNTDATLETSIARLMTLYRKGSYEDALSLGTELGIQFSNDVDILNIVGAVHSGLGQYEKAIISFKKATSLKVDFVDPHNNLGNALKKLGRNEQSAQSFKKAITLKPYYAEAYNNLGNVLKVLGKFDEAVKSYNKAINLSPNLSEAFNNLAAALDEVGRYDEAIEVLNACVAVTGETVSSFATRGNILKNLGEYDEAISNFNKAIQIDPNAPGMHASKGQILLLQGKYTDGLTLLRTHEGVIRFDSKDGYSLKTGGC